MLILPLGLFFIVFVILPLLLVLFLSLNNANMSALGSDNYRHFLNDGLSLPILGRTLVLGAKTSLVALLLAFPIALLFVASGQKLQRVLIFLIALPLLTSAVVRTFAWIIILGRQGVINEALLGLGFITQPLALLYTEGALVIALAQIELPLIALPLIAAMSAIDRRIIEASIALGGGYWGTLFRIIIPLSAPGILAGLLLVFAAACNALITQSIVGGGRLVFMPLYIYQQGLQAMNWPFAAAISMMLLLSVLTIVAAINWIGNRVTRPSHV